MLLASIFTEITRELVLEYIQEVKCQQEERRMANLLSKYVTPGCRVDLQTINRPNQRNGLGAKSYQSRVLDILSDDRLEISMPMEKSKLILLSVDSEYDMYFYSDSGLYQCHARVADRYKNDKVYVLVLDLTSNLRKQQRREYYRFNCALEMGSRALREEEEAALSDIGDQSILLLPLPLQSSTIVDISGGGLRFVADFAYEVHSLILCSFNLLINDDYKEYNLIGRVLSVIELENRDGVFEHRIQFVNVDKTEQEEIIKYIFDEERRVLRKQKR